MPVRDSPSYTQQIIRSAFYGISFGTAYILMLLAMSYNGGVILAIFAGGAVGHYISAVRPILRRCAELTCEPHVDTSLYRRSSQRDTATIQEVETVDDSPQARGECCC